MKKYLYLVSVLIVMLFFIVQNSVCQAEKRDVQKKIGNLSEELAESEQELKSHSESIERLLVDIEKIRNSQEAQPYLEGTEVWKLRTQEIKTYLAEPK